MWIMTVGTRHDALVYPVLEGHVELGADLGVAVVTKVCLPFGEQELRSRRPVDRMTARADHVVLRVFRPLDLCAVHVLRMACEAVIDDPFRSQFAKRDDRRLTSASFDVSFPTAMTRFAAGPVRPFRAGSDRPVMRVLVKICPNVRMARFAYRASDEVWCPCIRRCLQRTCLAPTNGGKKDSRYERAHLHIMLKMEIGSASAKQAR